MCDYEKFPNETSPTVSPGEEPSCASSDGKHTTDGDAEHDQVRMDGLEKETKRERLDGCGRKAKREREL